MIPKMHENLFAWKKDMKSCVYLKNGQLTPQLHVHVLYRFVLTG